MNHALLSQREVERRYNRIAIKEVSADRHNCYSCPNKHITKTIDIDSGTTPMFINCPVCQQRATSTFYNDIAPEQKPTHEWFRPTLEQTMKWRSKNPQMCEHILMGGLELRKIETL